MSEYEKAQSPQPPPQFLGPESGGYQQQVYEQQVYAQPLPQAPMAVPPGGNKNVNNLPYGPDGVRDWSTGLFDCCDDPEKSVLAVCCPCIVYAQNRQRFTHLTNHGTPDPTRGGPAVNTNCMMYAGLQLFHSAWLLQINVTSLVRQRYNIRGNPMKDVLIASSCIPCDLVRQSREIELEEQSLGQQRV